MGNTYHNVTVKGPTQEQIAAYLDVQKQAAFVSPTLHGLTFVYAPDDTWSILAEQLSRAFACPALFVSVYDSDVFAYDLYDAGRRVDTYNSAPDYFDEEADDFDEAEEGGDEAEEAAQHQVEPTGGDAHLLCITLGAEHAVTAVEAILHPPVSGAIRQSEMDAFDQHWAFAEALRWPAIACITDYRHLERDGVDTDLAEVFAGAPIVKTPR